VNILGVEYKPKENWTTSLSYSVSSGAPQSRLGGLSDGIFLEVKYSF
jgi:opacity protein-like surface antigen